MSDTDQKMVDSVDFPVVAPVEETAQKIESEVVAEPAGEGTTATSTEAVAEQNGDATTTTTAETGRKRERGIKFDASLLPESNDPAEIRKQVRRPHIL